MNFIYIHHSFCCIAGSTEQRPENTENRDQRRGAGAENVGWVVVGHRRRFLRRHICCSCKASLPSGTRRRKEDCISPLPLCRESMEKQTDFPFRSFPFVLYIESHLSLVCLPFFRIFFPSDWIFLSMILIPFPILKCRFLLF